MKIIQKLKVKKGFMSRWDRFLRVAIGFCVVCAAAHAAASIVINEIHYHPDLKTERVEFIELFNTDTNTVDLSGWYFSDGVTFTFPNGTFLAPGGYLHLATDWEDYAVQMLEVLSAEPMLQNTADGYAPQPAYRPLTKFENRGLKLGHGVWDLVFVKK